MSACLFVDQIICRKKCCRCRHCTNTNSLQRLMENLSVGEWCLAAIKFCSTGDKAGRGLPEYWAVACLTCEDRGKWLQGVKRTFQSARLHCGRQQLERAVLRVGQEDYITLSKNVNPTPELVPKLFLTHSSLYFTFLWPVSSMKAQVGWKAPVPQA